jgi:hypothetical protein
VTSGLIFLISFIAIAAGIATGMLLHWRLDEKACRGRQGNDQARRELPGDVVGGPDRPDDRFRKIFL